MQISRRTWRQRLEAARLYAILDTAYVAPEAWEAKAKALVEGGAGLIQVRAKAETPGVRQARVEAALSCTEPAGVPLIVNDDVALAARLPVAGLHVGQDDLSVVEARAQIGPDKLLGLSTHSPEQAAAAQAYGDALDYFAVGPVYATLTKPDYRPVGLELVRHVADSRPALPWFAIGGVNRSRLPAVLAAGARRIVVVSALLQADDTAVEARALVTAVEAEVPTATRTEPG